VDELSAIPAPLTVSSAAASDMVGRDRVSLNLPLLGGFRPAALFSGNAFSRMGWLIRVSSVERFLRLSLCSIFVVLAVSQVSAQVTATAPPLSTDLATYNNRWDAYGGFGYAHFQTTLGVNLKSNLYGFKGQATGWLSPVVGLTAGIGDYSGSVPLPTNAYNINSANISETLFLFGPEVRLLRDSKWTIDAHLLLGGAYGSFDSSFKSANIEPNALRLYNNQLAFAMAMGGSFDRNIKPNWSVRVITDFQPTHYGLAFQKEFAGSVGVVYKWGAIKK
jgi:hypothetical protein